MIDVTHKRLSAPRHYPIDRKESTWVSSSQGSYQQDYSLPLVVILREVLGYADNQKEVKRILHKGKVLVDGKKRRKKDYPVGFMDVISLPDADEDYRVLIDNKGLKLKETDEPDKKWTKIKGKNKLSGGKIQLNLFNGSNLTTDDDEAKTSSTLEVSLPDKEIKEVIELKQGNKAYIINGKHVGEIKTIDRVKKSEITFQEDETSTVPDYVYPINSSFQLTEDES